MKKLFSGKFLFILAACLLVLIGFGVGSFYLFDDNDAQFVKSGYVLNPLSEASEKYFFNKDTGYHQNLSSMVEFTDVDKNEVSILADSFLHYDDESLSFLKNGAILDLDSIDGEGAVKFYNITNASIIERDKEKYLIKAKNGDIVLDNFVGRINDNKYIVVGDLQLKLTGNTNTIEGEYFEIVYVEEGVVNIENKDVKYQVMADGTTIRVGTDTVIDLGDKKITVDDEDIMSLTAITIDGNENVEIIPSVTVEEKPSSEGDDGAGNGTDGNTGNANGEGQGGTGQEGNKPVENVKEILITLKDAAIGSTNVDVTFDIANASEEDEFSLQVVNLSTGRTVDMVASVISDVKIKVNLLTPNTKYLFTVVNNKDGNKYFQKIFETAGFGIKLEKSYATDDSIAYKVTIEEGTDITNATLSLYKYNEETKQNEIVTTSYYDSEKEETVSIPKITKIALNDDGTVEGVREIVYDGLDSDTIYTAVLDEFSVASSNFKDIYNITITSMTLKKTPLFSKMNVTQNAGAGQFELSLGEVTDPDNAIQKYTYLIYNKYDDNMAIDPVVKNNASPLILKIGEEENQLANDTNYYYKVIIEYFDNEKYIEYITTSDITFMMGNDPFITVAPNDEEISYDKIGGTIYLTDNSCLVSSPGRERCDAESTAVMVVSKVNSLTGELTAVYNKPIKFEALDGVLKYDFTLDGLQEGTTYNIDVKAILNNDVKNNLVNIAHTEESSQKITTKTLASLLVNWNVDDYPSDFEHVVNAGAQFIVDEERNDGSLSPEETVASIKKVVLQLYEGANIENIQSQNPIAARTLKNVEEEFNIKSAFYDNMFNVTSDGTFELSIDGLKALNKEGKLTEFYTVVVNAYYDEDGKKAIHLSNNIIAYEINKFLLLDNIDTPKLGVEEISNRASGGIFGNLNNSGTIVGYKLSAAFDRAGLLQNNMIPERIHFNVYSKNKKKVNFYIINDDGVLELVNSYVAELGESNFFEKKIYINYGTDYYNVDATMSRGNDYYVGYEVEVKNEGKTEMYPQVGPGKFENYYYTKTEKETPLLKMHITKSTATDITYEYDIIDPDNALYKEQDSESYNMYYTLGKGTTTDQDEASDDEAVVVDDSVEITSTITEMPLPLVKVVDENATVTRFNGKITISGLANGDFYSLYYKKAITKSGSLKADVLNYFDSEDDGMRMFDGFYDAKAVDSTGQSLYNFKYEIINNQLVDNKVTIKILAKKEMLDRIVAYKVNFVDSKGNKLLKELWQLSSCNDDDTVDRCLSVNYTDLKNAGMKSDKNVENLISVSVTALYDNGLTGYDYKIGTDYQYMIMQNNNTSSGMGSYVSFSNGGKITNWSKDLNTSKGYYTYTLNGNRITYKSQSGKHSALISFAYSSSGYLSNNVGVLNPKMISEDVMTADINVFSFSSITPKVLAEANSNLINGAKINLRLSGVDLNDLYNEGSKSKPEYYVYIDVWKEKSRAGIQKDKIRPSVKTLISEESPESQITAIVDGLEAGVKYYYNVYAKMYKDNKVEYIQLFDARYLDKYETKTYEFISLRANQVFDTIDVSYTSLKEKYGDRLFNTKITLSPYSKPYDEENQLEFNFDLVYVLCELGDPTCGVGSDNTNIFVREFKKEKVYSTVLDEVDISQYNLEFNKIYYMGVFARTNYYSSAADDSLTTQDILLNGYNVNVKLNKLTDPTYVVTRKASVTADGDYVLDFTINVSDADRTIVDGKYYVKLVDSTGKIVGNMQLLDDEGNYYKVDNYSEYAFDAAVANKSLRIGGLKPDTKYSIVVYANAFLNNYVEEEKDLSVEEKREKRTVVVSKSHTVYSVNDYGVAFGRDLLYSATAKSIVVTFLGGSNFDNVTKVRYTVGLWDSDPSSSSTLSGVYDLAEDTSKKFELFSNSEDWRFVIDPTDMKNTLNATYEVNLSFEVKNGEEFVWLTSADNPAFEGKVQYVEK